MTRRDDELARLRETYDRYDREGRDRLWDRANPGYARIARERDEALVSLVVAALPAGRQARVLDCGCGTGELADLVREQAPDVSWTGVDLRPQAIAAARSARPWATWHEASADAMPFDDASFDVVVAATLFSSLPSWEMEVAVAREIERVLRPGGTLVWYDLRYGNPWNRQVHGMSGRRIRRLFPMWPKDLRPVTLLPPIARRVASTSALAALEAFGPLRAHLIGSLAKPRAPVPFGPE